MAALAEATHSFNELETLFAPLSRWCSLEFEEVDRSSLRAIHCQVKLTPDAPSLSLEELRSRIGELLDASNGVEIAMTALDLIAAAEVEVHGGGVHLHELASVDTLVDLVGTAYLCAIARIDAISIMPVGINFGSMEMAHGQLPLPGPAVLSLLAKAGIGIYCFAIDFGGHIAERHVQEVITDLNRYLGHVKFLGSYPAFVNQKHHSEANSTIDPLIGELLGQIESSRPTQ